LIEAFGLTYVTGPTWRFSKDAAKILFYERNEWAEIGRQLESKQASPPLALPPSEKPKE